MIYLTADIKVSKETKKSLNQLKIDYDLKTFDDVVRMLLKRRRFHD